MPVEKDFIGKVAAHAFGQIESRLREAHLIAMNAKGFLVQGLEERLIEALLDVEPLMYEAQTLLDTLTMFRRNGLA